MMHNSFVSPLLIITVVLIVFFDCFPAFGLLQNVPPFVKLPISSSILKDGIINEPTSDAQSARAWVPPSQNIEQSRGGIFSILEPEDLLDFISEDERLCVVKVYASWCRTCKAFNSRYRKVASKFGDKYNDVNNMNNNEDNYVISMGKAKFAEMECAGSNAKMLKAILGTEGLSLPYILMYRGSSGLIKSFPCPPKHVQKLIDAVEELAYPIVDQSFSWNENGSALDEKALDILPNNSDWSNNSVQYSDEESTYRGMGATDFYLMSLTRAT